MPPWFLAGGAAVAALYLLLTGQAGAKRPGDAGAADEGAGEKAGQGAAEGEYIIPGDFLPGYEGLFGDEFGGDQYDTGFGDDLSPAEDTSGYVPGQVYQPPTDVQLATAAAYGWNVQQIPNYSADVGGGAATVPYVTDVGGQGAYVTPSGSVFEGQLPQYSSPTSGGVAAGTGGSSHITGRQE